MREIFLGNDAFKCKYNLKDICTFYTKMQYISVKTAIFNFLKMSNIDWTEKEILIHVYDYFQIIILHEKCTKIIYIDI